jgi:hypothetical protein
MKRRWLAMLVPVIIVLVLGAAFEVDYYLYRSPAHGATTSTTAAVTVSIPPSIAARGTGPISNFPAVWQNPCRSSAQGNVTTDNEVASTFAPGLANFTLDQVYASIVTSSSFQVAAGNNSWATGSWSLSSGASGGGYYVEGTFILLSGGKPAGYVIADYNNESGNVNATRERSLVYFGCAPSSSLAAGAVLDKGTPSYYPLGRPVKVIFEVNNSASGSLTLSSNDSCLGGFIVYGNLSGTMSPIYHSSQHASGCQGSTTPLSVALAAGSHYAQVQEWNQTYDNGTIVPTGIYQIVANTSASGTLPNLHDAVVGEVYLGMPLPLNPTVFEDSFSFTGAVVDSYLPVGTPQGIRWTLSNTGPQLYQIELSSCSLSYRILNLTNAVIYRSSEHAACGEQLEDASLPPGGLFNRTLYWNGTNDIGKSVGPGLYRAIIGLSVFSAGQEFNASEASDFMLTAPAGPTPDHSIVIAPTLSCTSSCGAGTTGATLSGVGYAKGNLKSIALYVNGTYIGTTNYALPCCQFTYTISLGGHLSAQLARAVEGASYDVVAVGTFSDGETAIAWAVNTGPPQFHFASTYPTTVNPLA